MDARFQEDKQKEIFRYLLWNHGILSLRILLCTQLISKIQLDILEDSIGRFQYQNKKKMILMALVAFKKLYSKSNEIPINVSVSVS